MKPSSSDVFGLLQTTGLSLVPAPGTFNTDTQCTSSAALGKCTSVIGSGDAPDACVCRADTLVVSDLKVAGSRALVLLVKDSIVVAGTLDVSAKGSTGGPGLTYVYSSSAVGTAGGNGGTYASAGGGSTVSAYGSTSLIPLLGGMSGQAGCGAKSGGGGGAIQITAGKEIVITGKVLANGGGAPAAPISNSCNGGPGGGSGGAILIEAPSVKISGVLAANGGGGAGGSTEDAQGGWGSDGTAGVTQASGGNASSAWTCPLYGYIYSGSGGKGASVSGGASSGSYGDSESGCLGSTVYAGNGGGGGGLGRIRINTGAGCDCGGALSPSPTFGVVQTG